jgi:hypothetical protein
MYIRMNGEEKPAGCCMARKWGGGDVMLCGGGGTQGRRCVLARKLSGKTQRLITLIICQPPGSEHCHWIQRISTLPASSEICKGKLRAYRLRKRYIGRERGEGLRGGKDKKGEESCLT